MNKTLAWRRTMRAGAVVGDVWVQLNPVNMRYRWRFPLRVEFMDWSPAIFGTAEDAFEDAKKVLHSGPSLVL